MIEGSNVWVYEYVVNGYKANAIAFPLDDNRIATLGTPYDITLQELRIECLFLADATTEQTWKLISSDTNT